MDGHEKSQSRWFHIRADSDRLPLKVVAVPLKAVAVPLKVVAAAVLAVAASVVGTAAAAPTAVVA